VDFLSKPAGFVFFRDLHKTSFIRSFKKQNQPEGSFRLVYSGFGGERGIRTPGPAIAGQRFSRPPHSTTLPFLHFHDNFFRIWPRSLSRKAELFLHNVSPILTGKFLRRKDSVFLFLLNSWSKCANYQKIKHINNLLTGFEHLIGRNMRNGSTNEEFRCFIKVGHFFKKIGIFALKVALFAENRKK
jgi:hypothetical protein